MKVKRLDFGELRLDAKGGSGSRTAQGFLRCDAVIARAGVQVYARPDGTERREYRPPDEVFHADALASAQHAPITFTPDAPNWHPQEPVTADNAERYTAGMTGPKAERAGDTVKTTAIIFKGDAIKAAEAGDFQQLSCGYDCDLDMAGGTTPDGERYDGVQRNIRINHVAMVRTGRAGPDVRLQLDANDNAVSAAPDPVAEAIRARDLANREAGRDPAREIQMQADAQHDPHAAQLELQKVHRNIGRDPTRERK